MFVINFMIHSMVSEELSSVETERKKTRGRFLNLKFQKNLVVWKLSHISIFFWHWYPFQKNLVVWKRA